MEDRNKSKARTADDEAESIVELTPEMELADQSGVRIIDLTDAIGGPVESTPFDPSSSMTDTPDDEPVSETEGREAIRPGQEEPSSVIEQEVDAAFDAVQAPIHEEPAPAAAPDELFDRLSDIPRRVDAALGEPQAEETPVAYVEAANAQAMDNALSADAAELDMAMAASPGDDAEEEIIELTDIADPAEIQTAEFQTDQDDHEIIELTEIVDPAELQVASTGEQPDDEEIIELTDMVDPDDLIAADENDREFLDETHQEHGPTGDLDDAEALAEEMEQNEAPSMEPIPIGAIPAFEDEPESEESVIRLSDVLNLQTRKDERPPIEQIKMGAEESLAKQNISIEEENTAEALGLDLERESREEDTPLTNRDIEAAVERIIQDKYAATIEQLIAKAVENAVTREIENIKRAMQDGDESQD